LQGENEQYHNPRTGLCTYILSFTEGSTRLELMQRPDVWRIKGLVIDS